METFTVASAVTAAMGVFNTVIDVLVGNPIFLVMIGGALIPIGFHIFGSAKNAVR